MSTEAKEPFEIIKSRHYGNTFEGESGDFVLQDLMSFCNLTNNIVGKDSNDTYYNIGKRDTILYIMQILNLNEFQVAAKMKLDNILNKEFARSSNYDASAASPYQKAIFGIKNKEKK